MDRGKATPETKSHMKKTANAKKKPLKRQEKAREKVWAKNQLLDIRRLTLANSCMQFGTFKNILSDPLTSDEASNNASDKSLIKPVGKNTTLLDPQLSAKLKIIKKKKTKRQLLTGQLSALKSARKTPRVWKSLTPPPVTMELIWLGKRKVKIMANAVKSTPPKQMRKATANT